MQSAFRKEMIVRRYRWRRLSGLLMEGLTVLTTVVAVGALVLLVGFVLLQGLPSISLSFFTELPRPVGEPGGGMAHAIVGTVVLVAMASVFGIPVGLLAGTYLAEYGRGRLPLAVRFVTDVLSGVPSISIGIFVYYLVVVPMGHFSALAGAAALAIMMIPTVTRATEEMLRLVPTDLREAGLALGIRQWRVIVSIALPSALPGVVTGIMLALARVAGETAPLLFTAFGNRYLSLAPDQPMAALTLQIFTYAISPYEEWHRQAWAGALVLMSMVLALNVIARLLARKHERPW